MKEPDHGAFFVLEGPDGSGKSTQARRLVAWLRASGRSVRHVRDPGGTRIGERVREILLDREHGEMAARTEALLYMASRAQLVEEVVRPALQAGEVVVCERWLPSTVAYQGYAGGLAVEEIWRLGELATGGLEPDLTLILDVAASEGLARIEGEPDRMEARAREFHEAVRQGYHAIAREGKMRSVLVPADGIEAVARAIGEAVSRVL